MSGGEEVTMSSAEAIWGMTILVIILIIVTFFFCLLPVYKALQARYTHWEDLENDPRWNSDQFQFSPTSPRMTREGTKYNRLSVCSNQTVSRGSSFRNTCVLPRLEDQIEIKMPPAYADIFNPGSAEVSSLGTPPAYYSHTPSDTEDSDKQDQLKNKPNQTESADAAGPKQANATKPSPGDANRPSPSDATRPGTVNATSSSPTEVIRPSLVKATRAGLAKATRPSPTDSISPSPTDPARPRPAEPVKPRPADPAKPRPADPAKPRPTNPAKPRPADPAKPIPADPAKPSSADPAKPIPADPAKPRPANRAKPSRAATVQKPIETAEPPAVKSSITVETSSEASAAAPSLPVKPRKTYKKIKKPPTE